MGPHLTPCRFLGRVLPQKSGCRQHSTANCGHSQEDHRLWSPPPRVAPLRLSSAPSAESRDRVFGASPLVRAWLFLVASFPPVEHPRAVSECPVCFPAGAEGGPEVPKSIPARGSIRSHPRCRK